MPLAMGLPALLPVLLLTPAAPASALTGCAAAGLRLVAPVATTRLASGVTVRAFHGTDGHGHPVRLTVAEADLGRVRLVAVGRRYGDVAPTTALVAAVPHALLGINGDYFSYDWSGDAVPSGPLVVDGRVLRMPAGAHLAVGGDAGGRPFAGLVAASGEVRFRGRRLPVASVNDGVDPGRADAVTSGRAVAVVTSWLGSSRPPRQREVVVRSGRVVATGHRVPFGPGASFGRGGDVLLAADGAAARALAGLRRGAAVRVSYSARIDGRARPAQAIGSGAPMVHLGRVLPPCAGTGALSRPRTVVAWTADRSRMWLLTVDGRGDGWPVARYGASYRQVAELARSLGASEAVMLDGGGSTTMAARGGDGRVRRIDAPDGTLQRPVPDGLVLVPR